MVDHKAGILAALDAIHAAFGRRDGATYREICVPEFAFLGSTEGEEALGNGKPITDMWEAIASRIGVAKFAVDWDSLDVDVMDDVALITGLGTAKYQSPWRKSESRYRLTGVLKRSGDRWLWRLYHASEPAPW